VTVDHLLPDQGPAVPERNPPAPGDPDGICSSRFSLRALLSTTVLPAPDAVQPCAGRALLRPSSCTASPERAGHRPCGYCVTADTALPLYRCPTGPRCLDARAHRRAVLPSSCAASPERAGHRSCLLPAPDAVQPCAGRALLRPSSCTAPPERAGHRSCFPPAYPVARLWISVATTGNLAAREGHVYSSHNRFPISEGEGFLEALRRVPDSDRRTPAEADSSTTPRRRTDHTRADAFPDPGGRESPTGSGLWHSHPTSTAPRRARAAHLR